MLRLVRITLDLNQPASFPFLHGRIVHALVRRALGLPTTEQFPDRIIPLAPESGRTGYDPGSPYALGLVLLPGFESFRPLVQGLRRLGQDRNRTGYHALGGNFSVRVIEDLVSGETLADDDPLEPLSIHGLAQASEKLADLNRLGVRFVSPLRLTRSQAQRLKGHAFCDADLFEPVRLLENLVNRTRNLLPDLPLPPPGAAGLAVGGQVRRLLWLDLPKHDVEQTTGGVVGQVDLEFPQGAGPAAFFLLLGQYLGAGKDISFGFGHYRLLTETGLPTLPGRAESLAAAAARQTPRPDLSREPDREKDDADDGDEVALDCSEPDWADPDDPDLSDLELAGLADGTRRPPPLSGRVLVNASGKSRALAIPPAVDQALQRRVQDFLAPSVDELLETSSYAFRRGFSRQGAAQALRRAFEHGYRWVWRTDIAAFFDSVDWTLLRFKLEALWDDDPLVDLLMRWTAAPVRFGDQLIQRDRGLPQGAVLSPLLANLYLDELDEEVSQAGFKLIRFADDLAICVRDREEGEAARGALVGALTDLALRLNPDKDLLTSFDTGFTYLGFVFLRSMVMEGEKKKKETVWLSEEADATPDFWAQAVRQAPAGAWLARLAASGQPLSGLSPMDAGPGLSRQVRAQVRRPIYLFDPDTTVRVSRGRLLIGADPVEEIPLALVESLVCFSPASVNGVVIRVCLQEGVPVHFLTATGALLGHVWPADDQVAATILQAQVDLIRDDSRRLTLAREFVAGKIANSRLVLQRRRGRVREDDLALAEMKTCLADIPAAQTIPELMAVEGRVARLYFQRLRDHLPPEFGFSSRAARPAADPVNAMLNFGYSLLHRQMSALLTIERLHPGLGALHLPSDRYHALASDVMEEFRHLVDLLILKLINMGQIVPADFAWSEKRGDCRIRDEARRLLVLGWRKKLEEEIRVEGEAESLGYRRLMHRQVKMLKKAILEPQEHNYRSYRGK